MTIETIEQIKKQLKRAKIEELSPLILLHKDDKREGVKKLIRIYENKLNKYQIIKNRNKSMLNFDLSYGDFVIGIDEVGRGPLFGAVVAAACNIKPSLELIEVYDSKKLTLTKREELFPKIIENANCYGVGVVEPEIIDKIGIQKSISIAMKNALDICYANNEMLNKNFKFADKENSLILADYINFDIDSYQYIPVIKGDNKSYQIACASIIAKVTRDRILVKLDSKYPQYDLKNNKGYGSKKHIDAIKKYGISDKHRLSFLKGILNESAY